MWDKCNQWMHAKAGKICISFVLVLILSVSAAFWWYYELPKFQNVTIELGSEFPGLDAFLTEYAVPVDWAQMLTEKDSINISSVGEQSVTFMHGWKIETITLSIVDTTPPSVTFQDQRVPVHQALAPGDFITECSDLSGIKIAFAMPPETPDTYGEHFVEVVVTDTYGNTTSKQCSVFYIWMQEAVTLELGSTMAKEDILLNAEKDGDLIDQTVLDEINASPVGEYTITSTSGGETCECIVTVQDTTPPELVLQWVTTYKGEPVAPEAFVQSVSDLSEPISVRFTDILPNFDVAEIQVVTIEAEDACGNIATEKATLEVVTDTTPPVISGLGNMVVAKNSTPDYVSGVSAYDDRDGAVKFTYDASKVNLSTAGTYFVTYYAQDSAGNQATARRKVTVNHDAADTAALVSSIASGLGSGAETLRDHVRNTIGYSSNWGGEDPVWYGFKNKTGNCYVHALCFQALLREKGYTTQLIWVTDKSHYWNLVYLNGKWVHMDSTPSVNTHSRYSIMNDTQRLETLSGRDWDHSAWPACP